MANANSRPGTARGQRNLSKAAASTLAREAAEAAPPQESWRELRPQFAAARREHTRLVSERFTATLEKVHELAPQASVERGIIGAELAGAARVPTISAGPAGDGNKLPRRLGDVNEWLIKPLGSLAIAASQAQALPELDNNQHEQLLNLARILNAAVMACRADDEAARRCLGNLATVARRYLRAEGKRLGPDGGRGDVIDSQTEFVWWLRNRVLDRGKALFVESFRPDGSVALRDAEDEEIEQQAAQFTDEFLDALLRGYSFTEVRRDLPAGEVDRGAVFVAVRKALSACDMYEACILQEMIGIDAVWRAALRAAGYPPRRVEALTDALRKRAGQRDLDPGKASSFPG